MKKILALMLAVLLALSLAACGEKENKPSGSNTDKPGTSQTDNQGGESTGGDATDEPSEPKDLSVAEVLALYGLTEDGVAPDEAYSEVVVDTGYSIKYTVTYNMDVDSLDPEIWMTKLYNAIAAIADDGKVYEASSGGAELPREEIGHTKNGDVWGYTYNGGPVMLEPRVLSDIDRTYIKLQIGFRAIPNS